MSEPANREEAIFDAASQLPPEQRADYLKQACAGNDALRQRVEALLKADAQAGDFMTEPAAPARPTIVLSFSPTERTGDKISHYKLLQQIGEGGCGVVYMAEQEEPVERRVALKVIKLGMDTKSVIARFEAERQALAMMDHPNIAKVLDAGSTDNGRPYFVMELVRGIKITDYCDQNKLSTTERLGLFMQVCNAIQHAHQKGIIHRDIKPSNILVTLHDGKPVPKVIDFGIAKATQGKLTDQTLFTAFEQFIGTPAYMSPEQAEMSGLDIDTRSDIYALGVLLYELLTGRTPFDPKELLQSGIDELRRTIREKEPERPSTRLRTMLNADLTAVAQRRQAEAPRLIHLLKGDLDWIVMKSLEKDRTRRYETANAMAMDIQRSLSNEPIIARPPGTLYRFKKLVRRNRTFFAATGVGMAALIVGLILSLYLFVQERVALKRAVAAEHVERQLQEQAEQDKVMSGQIAEASLLLMRNKWDEAERIVAPLPAHKSMVALFDYFGTAHARLGDWRQAITNYLKVVTIAPEDPGGYFNLLPLFVQVGDVDAYHDYCTRMLQQFSGITDPETATEVGGNCLMLPDPPIGFSVINKLIGIGTADGPGQEKWGEIQFIKTLAEYREGHFLNALDRIQDASTHPKNDENDATTEMYDMISAMSQYQLGQTNAATETLRKGLQFANANLPVAGKSSLGDNWNQWVLAQALMREAAAMILQTSAAAALTLVSEVPAWQTALTQAGDKYNAERRDDGTWDVEIDEQPLTNLMILHGASISRLSIENTAVSDLTPLRGMPLQELWIRGTRVTDLSPLRGMSLTMIQISETHVSDISPLRGMPLRKLRMSDCTNIDNIEPIAGITSLQSVMVPISATNLDLLRNDTNIERISFKYDRAIQGPAQTAAEFWAQQDKLKATAP